MIPEDTVLEIWNLVTTLGVLPALLFWLYLRERQDKMHYLELYHETLRELAGARLQSIAMYQDMVSMTREQSDPNYSPPV